MKKALLLILIIGLFLSCSPERLVKVEEITEEKEILTEASDLSNTDFPEDFDFETTALVNLQIQESDPEAHYNVYLYHIDLLDPAQYAAANQEVKSNTDKVGLEGITLLDEIYSGAAQNGVLQLKADIPTYTNALYVRRRVGKSYQGAFVQVEEGIIQLSSTSFSKDFSSKSTGQNEYLVAVNGVAEIHLISPTTGESVLLDILPEGTSAMAYSKQEQSLYAVSQDNAHELLRKFDLATGQWTYVGNAGTGSAQRMVMNPDGTSLYL